MRATIVVVIAAALAGCGSSPPGREASAPPPTTQTQVHTEAPRAKAKLAPPCSRRARAAIPGGAERAEPFKARSRAASCRLEGPELTAIVMLDSAPQPYVRMEREVVEFGQNIYSSGSSTAGYPRTVGHLGLDADWFPLQSRLLTTDGVRLITVKLHAGSIGPSERKAIATRMARVYLGPLVKPPGY